MPFFGNLIGQGLGYGASKLFGGSDGVTNVAKDIGGTLGSYLIPFKKGGKVRKAKTGYARERSSTRKFRKGGTADADAYVMGGISRLNPAPNHAGFTLMPLPSRIKLM